MNYKQVYINAMGYSKEDFIASELSGKPAVDIHHIISRGKRGEDRIENLMALTREEHIKYGDKKNHMLKLILGHREFLELSGVKYSHRYFNELIQYYAH